MIFFDYTHSLKNIISETNGYLPSYCFCHSYQELYHKTKKFISKDFSKENIEELNKIKKIYSVKNKKTFKDKIAEIIEKEI